MENSLYHKFLRICALTLSLVLLFVSGIFSPITKQLSDDAGVYVATAIGINAAVMPTEVNTLSAQLLEREKELSEREIAVDLKEAQAKSSDLSTFILSVLLFILLVLIVLNYALDYIRGKQKTTLQAS
jgi:hypothetical protein